MKQFLKLLIFIPIIVFSSCAAKPVGIIVTDSAEILSFVEYFNTNSDLGKFQIIYSQDPAAELLERRPIQADIVISDTINQLSVIGQFKNLQSYFETENSQEGEDINAEAFYPELLKAGVFESDQKLLPLSYSMHVLLSKADEQEDQTASIPSSLLIEQSIELDSAGRGSSYGFSPIWSQEFLLQFLEYHGSTLIADSPLLFDSEAVEAAAVELSTWYNNLQFEDAFTIKYSRTPFYQLLLEERIQYYFADISELLKLPQQERENLEYRLVEFNDVIPVSGEVQYIGIPQRASHPRLAKQFVKWLFQDETQRALIENNLNLQISSYGFGLGFSSLKDINELELQRNYPSLEVFPDENKLVPRTARNSYWEELYSEVLIPWIMNRMKGLSDRSLEEAIEVWKLQTPLQN
jgi:hypothetical protein